MELGDRTDDLRRYFAGRLPQRLGELEDSCRAARDAGWRGMPLRTFHRLAHSLAGSGAIFGFTEVSDLARRLERLLKPVLENGMPVTEADERTIGELLGRLREAAARPHD
ncbi:MAG TPA: Hpt domain-containing protein [Solirubrobacterales bacterium]|jgi:HPt (histidine-containing phosphotransfer) domain-containing protein